MGEVLQECEKNFCEVSRSPKAARASETYSSGPVFVNAALDIAALRAAYTGRTDRKIRQEARPESRYSAPEVRTIQLSHDGTAAQMNVSAQENKASTNEIERLLPVLVHIQANLDQDLSLEALANRFGSPTSIFTVCFVPPSVKH